MGMGAGAVAALTRCGAPGATGGAPAAPASAPPVAVRWTNDVGTPLADAFNAQFNRRFNDKFGPRIIATTEGFPDPDWGKRYEKYTAMAVAGTLPEIVWLCCTYVRPFMLKGLAAALDPYIKRDWKPAEIDDFYKGPYDAFRINGKQMGVPVYINTNILFVNRNHLKETGLDYPREDWTKAQFLDYVVKLNRRGGERWGYDMPFTGLDRNVTWIWNNGGEPHDPEDGPLVTKLTYDDPKTVEGLQFLHDLLWKHQVSPAGNDQRGGQSTEDAFLNGKIAIYMNASGNAGNVSNKAPGTGLDWDFLPLPKGPGGYGARISTDGYMVDAQTPHGEPAWTVLRELVSAEAATIRAQQQRQQPPRKSAAATWERVYEGKNAKLGRLMAETARADPRAFWKDADQVGAIMAKYMQATLTRNELGVQQATQQAMEEVRGFYAGTK
jgi:ABC-type glycerol-3-phosphate transport system substrate-binding protein